MAAGWGVSLPRSPSLDYFFISCTLPNTHTHTDKRTRSLLAATMDFKDVAAASCLEALKWLCKNGFIKWVG